MIHLSVVCCGRAVPLLWRVLEHPSATVAFAEYCPLLRQARWLLRHHRDVMLLADRGFANHELMSGFQTSGWHYCLRLPCDVLLHGPRRHPIEVKYLWPPKGEAMFCYNVGLWQDGRFCRINHGMIHLHSYLFDVIYRSFRVHVSSHPVQVEALPA